VSSAKVHDRSINFQIEGLFGHEWPRLEPEQDTASVIRHPPSAICHPPLPGSARNTVVEAQMQRAFVSTQPTNVRWKMQAVRQSRIARATGVRLDDHPSTKKHKRTALVCRPLPAGNLASGQQEKHNRPLCQLVG
jgi:hypothetical protein